MAIPLAMEPRDSFDKKVTPFVKAPIADAKKTRNLSEILCDGKTKSILNCAVNGSASAFAFFTFLNGNFRFFESLQEYIEPVSEKLERLGNALSGVIGGIDLWQKRNFFPFAGYISMVPISLLFDSYNNWLMRGFSIGLNSFVFIIDRREVVDEKGEPVKDKKGEVKHLSGDFSDKGWLGGIKTTCNESYKMLWELCEKPARIKRFSHAILITSLVQTVSPFIAYFGERKIGSIIRNVAGIAGYIGLLLDRRKSSTKFLGGINFKSPVVQCSLLRIGTSVFDLMKRFDFFSSRITNLTDISLALDRLAGLRFTKGIFDIKKKK